MESSSALGSRPVWRLRLERVRELCDRPATAAGPLRFYEKILQFQADVAARCNSVIQPTVRFRNQIDRKFALANMPRVLGPACEHGPRELSDYAQKLKQLRKSDWETILERAIADQHDEGPLENFFSRACIQPIAEKLQAQIPPDPHYLKSTCPACGGLPQLAILRPEGEGARRSLQCSFCLREWNFRRIACPACGSEDKEKLPRYSASECAPVSLEACDSCSSYLKCVDMSIDGHAEPLVDEAAAAALDLYAAQRGYTKIASNLLGF